MRKTSQDGGDTTSITSGVENEIKKPSVGIVKTKRNSIKRKVQTLSHESDDAVIEPLLQKEKEKPEPANQSAKFSILKSKTEIVLESEGETDKLLSDTKSKTSGIQETSFSSLQKENMPSKTQPNTIAPIHNHMNTNVFSSIETPKYISTTKSQILVEIDGCKQGSYNPSPLIFTTAKIHTDNKTKHMEPVQVTSVPILSTAEIANSGKATNNISILQAIPSTSEIKVNEKSLKHFPVTSSVKSETGQKNAPSTTSENKTQNNFIDRAIPSSSSLVKDSTKSPVITTDVQVCKSVSNKVIVPVSVSSASSKICPSLKNDFVTKTPQIQSSHYTDVKTSNVVNISKESSTSSEITVKKSKTEDVVTKTDKAASVKRDTPKQQDGRIDENANTSIGTVQHLGRQGATDTKKSPVDAKKFPDSVSKDKTPKDAASISNNKLLLRQKNAIVEEVGDVILKSKPHSEYSSASNIPKFSKEPESKPSAPVKSTMQSKMTDRDVSDKTLPKPSANNIVDYTMTTKITATSIVTKPTTSLSSTVKSPVTNKPQSIAVPTSLSTTTKSKIPSVDTKVKSSVMPTITSPTLSSKPSSTLTPTIPTTTYSKVSTISSVKPAGTSVTALNTGIGKLNGAATTKPTSNIAPKVSSENILTTTANGSSSSSIPLKSSTVKTTMSGAKSTVTLPATTSAASKKNGPKTNEVNKDKKGFKT